MHRLQHASFAITALLFWWSLFYGRGGQRGYGAAVFYLFATTLHSGVLGLAIALSPKLLFPGITEAGARHVAAYLYARR